MRQKHSTDRKPSETHEQLIGDGSIAAFVVVRKVPDLFTTCLAFGVGGMLGTFVAGRISGAHLNPAASLAQALAGQLSVAQLATYIVAQYCGGCLATLVLYANYYEGLHALDGGAHSAFGGVNSTGSIFATYPAAYVSVWGALGDQVLGTAVLVFCLTAICDARNANLPRAGQPFAVALTIALVCVAFAPNCGAIFNPARDLAPRAMTALLGYSTAFAPLSGLYWLVAGLLGPHLGAVLGLFGYKALVGRALDVVAQVEAPQKSVDERQEANKAQLMSVVLVDGNDGE